MTDAATAAVVHEIEHFSLETEGKLAELEEWNITADNVFQLSERNMTVAERAEFAKAKRQELSSFFENKVWEFCNEVEPNRTLRANF